MVSELQEKFRSRQNKCFDWRSEEYVGGSYVLKKGKKNLISISLLNFQSCFFLLLLPLCSHPVSPQVGIRAGQGSVSKDLKRFL